MPEKEPLDDYVVQIRAEADRAGISISEEHARLAADWRGTYEASVASVRKMDYSNYEPGAIFVPVTELSITSDTKA